jgi:hypothetical protein
MMLLRTIAIILLHDRSVEHTYVPSIPPESGVQAADKVNYITWNQ